MAYPYEHLVATAEASFSQTFICFTLLKLKDTGPSKSRSFESLDSLQEFFFLKSLTECLLAFGGSVRLNEMGPSNSLNLASLRCALKEDCLDNVLSFDDVSEITDEEDEDDPDSLCSSEDLLDHNLCSVFIVVRLL